MENVQVRLPEPGELKLVFNGFEYADFDRFNVILYQGGREHQFLRENLTYRLTDRSGELNEELGSGLWTLSLSYEIGNRRGLLEKSIQIRPGESTRMTFAKDELPVFDGWTSYKGQLLIDSLLRDDFRDGELTFTHYRVKYEHSTSWWERHQYKAKIDERGGFEVECLLPGRWKVEVVSPEGDRIRLKNPVVISNTQSVFLEIPIPYGSVSGTLLNGRSTKLPNDTAWTISLYPREILGRDNPFLIYLNRTFHYESAQRIEQGRGAKVRIHGIPAGNYIMVIETEGFDDAMIEMVRVENGQVFDFDQVILRTDG